MRRYPEVAGFILAGGHSSRMGRDKALLEIAGVPMLARAAQLLEPLVADVTIIGPPERYAPFRWRVVPDDLVGAGPLGGLATALRCSSSEWSLVVACDLPYLSREWLDWLITRALPSQAEAVVPESVRGLEPLCALYRSGCVAPLSAHTATGHRKLTEAVASLSLQRVPESEWKSFDADGMLLKNMNRPEDYAAARARLEANEYRSPR